VLLLAPNPENLTMKKLFTLALISLTFGTAHANRTVCEQDLFGRLVCTNTVDSTLDINRGWSAGSSTRTVCERDLFNRVVCNSN
jgi:hypothetical protein